MLTGDLLIGGSRFSREGRFYAVDAATAAVIPEPAFSIATPDDVAAACAMAAAAFVPYANLPFNHRAAFLEAIAAEVEALGEELMHWAGRETGLPAARLSGERIRTTNQLRLFAQTVRDGRWQENRHDPAGPQRVPPKPDLRLCKIAIGLVAVFGASNFPLAFSVAGGDTASALAAGCPVVVKGHPAHPGTSALVATAVLKAAVRTGMPEGVFSLLAGPGNELGAALVADPRIKAVGFTGSRTGGLALMKVAAERAVPIPVYAEMSSINPVILMPAALASRPVALAEGYVASMTLGAGQFCTNPGLVLVIEGNGFDVFVKRAGDLVSAAAAQTMLSAGIHRAYAEGRARLAASAAVACVAKGQASEQLSSGQAALFSISGAAFLSDPVYAHEVFGATSLIVQCRDLAELTRIVATLEGQLTATLHMDPADYDAARTLLPLLEQLAGRIIANGWPTGVEVSPAMVHGGPFPATSDGRSTSVGTLAIDRFLRPICYQDMPEEFIGTDCSHDRTPICDSINDRRQFG